ncbi:hypothetical protein RIF29_41261 [Crotalaria pallida]|uniref:Ribosomal RNA-processing protein 7 C-terminal domain-containing protein n=1 Tax=Crotalaria pallida TaxID=3830 RepID=A0AAN9HV34_CROPI
MKAISGYWVNWPQAQWVFQWYPAQPEEAAEYPPPPSRTGVSVTGCYYCMMKGKGKLEKNTVVEEKRKRKREKIAVIETDTALNTQVDNGVKVGKKKKEKSSSIDKKKKRKNKDKDLVGKQRPKDEADVEEKSVDNCLSEAQDDVQDFKEHGDADTGPAIKPGRSKKGKKKRRKEDRLVKEVQISPEKEESLVKEVQISPEKEEEPVQDDIYIISSGDEDNSKGMKKWITEYHQSRPGLKVLQHQIDDFITAHEEKLEEERKEREARAAEGGWTVVVHHKGRKKTTDAESGVAVGSVAQAAVENKMNKKKPNEVGLDFYRFQRREAQRNEIMMLQSKFEEDKKRLQQLRAARKFRPY